MLRLIILIAFLESFVSAMVERGISFYAEHELGFTQSQNLLLSLLFGAAYVVGALGSHRASHRLGERAWLIVMVLTHIALHLVLALEPGTVMVFILTTLLGASSGSKWPVVESYATAGMTPRASVGAVGHFNLAWSSAVVPAVALSGMLIEAWPPSLFLAPAILNAFVIVMIYALPREPVHLAHDHPERPNDRHVVRLKSLLASSRWSMFGSYTLLFLLAPLLPYIFRDRLSFDPGPATAMVALIDLTRFVTFAVMQRYIGWHGKRSVLLWTIALMPVGFLMTLLGSDLATVLTGEVLFGIAAGLTYYAALYYAMVVQNAAVEAGGAHEGFIGSGFVVGPAIGLAGIFLGGSAIDTPSTLALTTAPFLVICAAGALWALRNAREGDHFHFPD